MDGNMHTFKARLVVKGYTQTQRIDYEETFSLVTNIKSIILLLSIAALYDYEVYKIDVKSAFLYGNLIEDVCMVQPKRFIDLKYMNRVWKLKRSIYGLKQESQRVPIFLM